MSLNVEQLHESFLALAAQHQERHAARLRGECVREGAEMPVGQTEVLYLKGQKFMVNPEVSGYIKTLEGKCLALKSQIEAMNTALKTPEVTVKKVTVNPGGELSIEKEKDDASGK